MFCPRPSYLLISLLVMNSGGAIASVFLAMIPFSVQCLLTLAIVIYSVVIIRHHLFSIPPCFYRDGHHWYLQTQQDTMLVKLDQCSVVTRSILLLRFTAILAKPHTTLWLLPDSLPPQQWRQLQSILAVQRLSVGTG